MKLLKVSVLMIESYKRGCKSSFDKEGYSISVSLLKLRKENKKLKKYIRHETNCHVNRMPRFNNKKYKCTCGFSKMVSELRSKK
ncbi:hypothetical protein LCGC14_2164530 [marine sediment metagenome]|uniref:Uncharacterized protein n=1 Tax=marine sediment metagenome TaxID=412755 RepID=A0A0F9GMX8_9ZZZZ